jgi:hypothetical protein
MNASNANPLLNYTGSWSCQASYIFSPTSFSMIMLWSTTHAIKTSTITSLFHCLLDLQSLEIWLGKPQNNTPHPSTHFLDILQNVVTFHLAIHGLFEQK